MEFNGTFDIEGATLDEVWVALSDPVMIRDALPGCQFVVEVDDDNPDFDELRERVESEERLETTTDTEVMKERAFEEGGTYAALMQVSVGSVNPSFETVIRLTEREKYRMSAEGEGSASGSSFEMEAGMELNETESGVAVEWWADAEVFGKIAQMGQRVINPVTNRVVKKFFTNVQSQIEELQEREAEAKAAEAAGEEEITPEAPTSTATADESPGPFGRLVGRIRGFLKIGGWW